MYDTQFMLKLEILVGGLENVSCCTVDVTKTAVHLSHVTYSQAPAVCEKKKIHLFHFTQPVENYTYF